MYFQISLITGIVPAVLILYWMMGKYEGILEEKKLFMYMIFGFILGIIFSLFFLLLAYSTHSYLDLSIVFVIFFALLIEIVKFVIMARRKVVKDYRILFYGSALGMGIAGTFITGLEYRYFLERENFAFSDLVGFIILSVSLTITQFYSGFFVCKAISTTLITRYFGYSFFLQALYNIALLPYIWNFHVLITAVFTTPFLSLFLFIDKTVLDSLPKDISRKIKRWKNA